MRHLHHIVPSLLLISCVIPAAAMAVPVTIPSVTEPSRAGDRLQLQVERPEVGGQSVITLSDDAGHKKALKGDVTFTLKKINFENLTAFTQEQLRPDYESYIGKQVSLATLNDIAAKITARYRNAGYILSRAVVPPQRIDSGIVKIKIVEGYIDQVHFEGVPATNGLLGKYADKIRNSKPLDAKTLERYLLLMNDLPGVTAHAVIKPSPTAPGASDVLVTIAQKRIDGSATFDNRSTRYMGPFEAGLTVNLNNILGLYERTTIRGVTATKPSELWFGEIIHEEQLDSEGTKLALSGGYTHTHPGYLLEPLEVSGRDLVLSAAATHPFIRSRQSNLFGDVKFDVRQTDVSARSITQYDDKLRVARLGGSYDFTDSSSAVNKVETEFSKGFNWGAGSDGAGRSHATGQADFFKATALASRLQPIKGPFDLYVAASGQASANTLMVAEQMGIGGSQFGSAYDPSEITGDSGIAGRAELQYNRSGDFKYLPSYQLYGFYDVGKVWTRNPAAGDKSSESLADTGIGMRFNILEPVSGGVELAVPLTRRVAANNQNGNGDSPRVFGFLAYRF